LDAVVGVDLEVYRGEIFAFLGPNADIQHVRTQPQPARALKRCLQPAHVWGFDALAEGAAWEDELESLLQPTFRGHPVGLEIDKPGLRE
jgi:hypothetical protein